MYGATLPGAATAEKRRRELDFHITVRSLQAGDWIERARIVVVLEELYGVKSLAEAPSHGASDFTGLPGDMLAKTFTYLTLEERNNARLVCQQWKRKAFAFNDPRILRGSILWRVSHAEVVQFLTANPTVTRLGRVNWKRLASLLDAPMFPAHRISEIRVEDAPARSPSHWPEHYRLPNALARMFETLPNLRECSIFVPDGVYGHGAKMRLPLQLRTLRVFGRSKIWAMTSFGFESDQLRELEIDEGADRDLNVILRQFPSLESLTFQIDSNPAADPIEGSVKHLTLIASRERRVRSHIGDDIACLPLVSFSSLIDRGLEELPQSLKKVRLEERSTVHEKAGELSWPVGLQELDLMEVACNAEHVAELAKLEELRRLRIRMLPGQVFAPGLFPNLTHLALSVAGNKRLDWNLPVTLKSLEVIACKDWSFAAVEKCENLRELILRDCSGSAERMEWQALPRNLFRLVIEVDYETRRCFQLTVENWIGLPPFLCNAPRIDSVLEGLVQFM